MPEPSPPAAVLERILELLGAHRLMTLATLRPDGWPQATVVNYVADGLRLYFVVSSGSQKLANIRHDPRVSIAFGAVSDGAPLGLSLAARVREVVDPNEVAAVNEQAATALPGHDFTPHPATTNSALLAADPVIVSLIDYDGPAAAAQLFRVEHDWKLTPIASPLPETFE